MKTYVWNARDQLIKVQQGGADLAVFTYDGAGRRATKTAGGVTRSYVYDGPDILEERVSTGDVIRYVHGPGMDNVLARTTNGINATYYAADHLGSIVHETDAAGAVTLARAYDAWGEPTQGQATSGFAFTGREWDAEVGLYYYRARYYDPSAGRFAGEDPAGFVDGPNMMAYAANNPVRFTDPTGLAVGDWWDVYSNLRRSAAIAREELAKRSTQHNDAGDAMRHAEWMRRTAQETNAFTALLAGLGHELEGMLQGQPLAEALMDMHNNAEGRRAGSDGRPVDPDRLQTLDGADKSYRPPAPQRPYDTYPKRAEGSCR